MVSKQSILGDGSVDQISASFEEMQKMIVELKELVMNQTPIENSSSDQHRPPPAPPHPQPHPFYSSEFSPPPLIPQFNTNEFTASYVFDESSAPTWVYGQSQFSPQIYNQQYWLPSYNPNHMSPLYSAHHQFNYSQPHPYLTPAPQHQYALTIQTTLSSGQPYYAIESTPAEEGYANVSPFGELSHVNTWFKIGCEGDNKQEVAIESEMNNELGVDQEDKSVYEDCGDTCEIDYETETEAEVCCEDEVKNEVDTNAERLMVRKLSRNVMDTCPEGLTSKSFALKAQMWELKSTESIAYIDTISKSIQMDRRVSEAWNKECIFDKTSVFYDGLKRQPSSDPMIREAGFHCKTLSWRNALVVAAKAFHQVNPKEIAGVVGKLSDIESMMALEGLLNKMRSNNVWWEENDLNVNADLRYEYLLYDGIGGLENVIAFLLVDTHPREEATIVNAKIRNDVVIVTYIEGSYRKVTKDVGLIVDLNNLLTIIELNVVVITFGLDMKIGCSTEQNVRIFDPGGTNTGNRLKGKVTGVMDDVRGQRVNTSLTNEHKVTEQEDSAPSEMEDYKKRHLNLVFITYFDTGKHKHIFTQGSAGNGLQKTYKQVSAWKFYLTNVNPDIMLLSSKENNWMTLEKPRRSHEYIFRTILTAPQSLHFLRKNPEVFGRSLRYHLCKAFRFEPRPLETDLMNIVNLISQVVKKDEVLAKVKIVTSFLDKNSREWKSIERLLDAEGTTMMKSLFIVDDGIFYESVESECDDEEYGGKVCAICDNGGSIICCEGKCLRSFHATKEVGVDSAFDSLGLVDEQVEAIQNFYCKNCQYMCHQCFACGELGSFDNQSASFVVCLIMYHILEDKNILKRRHM